MLTSGQLPCILELHNLDRSWNWFGAGSQLVVVLQRHSLLKKVSLIEAKLDDAYVDLIIMEPLLAQLCACCEGQLPTVCSN